MIVIELVAVDHVSYPVLFAIELFESVNMITADRLAMITCRLQQTTNSHSCEAIDSTNKMEDK